MVAIQMVGHNVNYGSYYLYPLKIPDVRTFVLTFNAFGRWAPEAPIDQTLRFRLVRASGFPSPKKNRRRVFPHQKKNRVFLASWTFSKFLVFWRFFGRFWSSCSTTNARPDDVGGSGGREPPQLNLR